MEKRRFRTLLRQILARRVDLCAMQHTNVHFLYILSARVARSPLYCTGFLEARTSIGRHERCAAVSCTGTAVVAYRACLAVVGSNPSFALWCGVVIAQRACLVATGTEPVLERRVQHVTPSFARLLSLPRSASVYMCYEPASCTPRMSRFLKRSARFRWLKIRNLFSQHNTLSMYWRQTPPPTVTTI